MSDLAALTAPVRTPNGESERAEYVVHAKVKNNLLLSRILAAHKNVAAFCEEHGLAQTKVGDLVNMKTRALGDDGWKSLPMTLADIFGCDPEDLFSEEQRRLSLRTNEAFIEMTRQQALQCADPLAALDAKDLVAKLIQHSRCTPRERQVLDLRFEQDKTREEIGAMFGVTSSQIQQIEEKALRRLRAVAGYFGEQG